MLNLFVVQKCQPRQYLLSVISYGHLIEVAILRQHVGQTGLHLLEVHTEELVEELAAVESHYVFVF
jgi:hypothetical protein